MIVTFQPPHFIWRGEFSERRVPEQAGFEWVDRAWRTKTAAVAERLAEYMDAAARARVVQIKAEVEVSYCADATLDVPVDNVERPAGQEAQDGDPAKIEYLPEGQALQPEPLDDVIPGGQLAQVEID